MRKLFILFIAPLYLISCVDPVTEVKENIFSAQDNALAENEYNSTVEAITDWVANAKFYKKSDRIVPGSVVVTLKYSSFLDMDGIEGTIDFGSAGMTKPYGLLCSDGKYRSGKIHFKLNQPIELTGSVLQLVCEKQDYFMSGSGDEMNQLSGTFRVENQDGMSLVLKGDRITLTDGKGNIVEWWCNRTIRLVKDAGKGIWGDIYSMEGNASGINRSGEKYEVTIEEPLIKKMEAGCSKTFVKGRLSIKNESSDKTIQVNYDPNNNEACDYILEADINGKKTIFRVE